MTSAKYGGETIFLTLLKTTPSKFSYDARSQNRGLSEFRTTWLCENVANPAKPEMAAISLFNVKEPSMKSKIHEII